MNDLPFKLNNNEYVIFNTFSFYIPYFLKSSGSHFGIYSGGIFGGSSSSKASYIRGEITDGIISHVYLTNQRLILCKAGYSLFKGNTSIGDMYKSFDLNIINGVYLGKKGRKKYEVEIEAGDKFLLDFDDKHEIGLHFYNELEDLILKLKNIDKYKEENIITDAMEILKLRYAKGEITKEQYEEMKNTLCK